MKAAAAASIALLALLAVTLACGGSAGLEPRYSGFSARDATLEIADLPPGWEFLPSGELPSLRDFLPESAKLVDSVVMVATNGEEEHDALQAIAVGIALLGGEDEQPDGQGIAGLALRAVDSDFDLSRLAFMPAGEQTPGSTRLKYTAPAAGGSFITEAINLRDGRILADIEVLYSGRSTPPADVGELAAVVQQRISQQLQGPD